MVDVDGLVPSTDRYEQSMSEPLSELVSVLIADLRGGDLRFRTFLLEKGLNEEVLAKRTIWL